MALTTLDFAGMRLEIPSDWFEASANNRTLVPTLTKHEGVGALQFTVARHVSGPAPQISHEDAEGMLRTYLRSIGIIGEMKPERSVSPHGLLIVQANFMGRRFLRVWMITDGKNSAIATYLTSTPRTSGFRDEYYESDAIVSSIRFPEIMV